MALLPKGALVLIADGEKALFLENAGTATVPKLSLRDKMEHEVLPNHELVTDRPGRMPDPGPGQLSAMEQPDHNRIGKEKFAGEIAARTNGLGAEALAKGLVVAAPPQMLAVLREKFSPAVTAAVIAQLPKSLTHHPLDRVAELVARDIDSL